MSFVAAYRMAPRYMQKIAAQLFYGRHPEAAAQPGVSEALREAERFNEIARTLLGKEVAPELDLAGGFEIRARLGGDTFDLTRLSSGEGMLLTWAILLHSAAGSIRDAVVLIDEPELHLHPAALNRILSPLLVAFGTRGQLWTVTHSPAIAERDDVTNLFLFDHGTPVPLSAKPPSSAEIALSLIVDKPPKTLPSPSRPQAPVGTSDFRKIRTSESLVYVDKTRFIEDVLCHPAEVLLFPRPRRFGKTLNLSALRSFVEKGNAESSLFEGLRVWQSAEARKHFGRYPVIHLTFKDVKAETWGECIEKVAALLADLYREHRHLLDGLAPEDAEDFSKILHRQASQAQCEIGLKTLSRHLRHHHGMPAMILLDEYDTPLHTAYENDYYEPAVSFFRNFYSAGLKDNPHLFKGVLTGVLRIARDSLFSGLNNIAVYSILRPEFASHFGFTESEVEELCARLGVPDRMNGLREWYNGYLFGGEVLFNPWSVMSCLASSDQELAPYWTETGSNKLVRKQLFERGRGLGGELSTLLRGEPIHKPIQEDLVLRNLDTDPDALWSLLLFSGYLKPASVQRGTDTTGVPLTIPNLEVKREFEKLVRQYFSQPVGGENDAERMLAALLRGDKEELQAYLNQFLTYNMSPYDMDSRNPERVYHVFLLGMLVFLGSRYEVTSNRIAGRGRYDLLLRPKAPGQPGVCVELKRSRGDVTKELADAFGQIEERAYDIELRRCGAHPIHRIAMVFDGQRAWVDVKSRD